MSFEFRKNGDYQYIVCQPLEKAGFQNEFGTRKGTSIASVIFLKQIHSDIRHVISTPPAQKEEGDALLSHNENLLIGVRTADCLPILMGDPTTGWFSAIHAGWRGTAQKIAQKTVEDLKNSHKVNPINLIVALGPSACGKCYEVGPEVKQQLKPNGVFTPSKKPTHTYLDNTETIVNQLKMAGLEEKNIYKAPYCTMHQNDLFYSHRIEGREDPKSVGRMLSFIGHRK